MTDTPITAENLITDWIASSALSARSAEMVHMFRRRISVDGERSIGRWMFKPYDTVAGALRYARSGSTIKIVSDTSEMIRIIEERNRRDRMTFEIIIQLPYLPKPWEE